MWGPTIVSEYMALGIICLGVGWSWLAPLANRKYRRRNRRSTDILVIVAVGWLAYGAVHSFWWGVARHGMLMEEDWSQWMSRSPFVVSFLAVSIVVGMAHIIKATYARAGWRPAVGWAIAAGAAAVWPEHIVGALRVLTGI